LTVTAGVRTPSDALPGPVAVATIAVATIEAETNRAFADGGRHLVVLAGHTRRPVIGLSQIVALSEVGTLVTDDGLDADAQSVMANRVGELIVASPGAWPRS
jgi:DeoR/GlpR family transcriptional regulator of sugar metabolism